MLEILVGALIWSWKIFLGAFIMSLIGGKNPYVVVWIYSKVSWLWKKYSPEAWKEINDLIGKLKDRL